MKLGEMFRAGRIEDQQIVNKYLFLLSIFIKELLLSQCVSDMNRRKIARNTFFGYGGVIKMVHF